MFGPCGWPVPPCDDDYGLEPADARDVEAEAVFILWSFTGSRFGLCDTVVASVPGCTCRAGCGCGSCVWPLPGPVYDVLLVTVDDVPVWDWTVVDNTVVRDRPWPATGVEITYRRGYPVPPGGGRAVGELARELALSRCGDEKCRVPATLTQRVRGGDTITLTPLEPGLTGLPSVDMWVHAAVGASVTGRVWSPDVAPVSVQQVGGTSP